MVAVVSLLVIRVSCVVLQVAVTAVAGLIKTGFLQLRVVNT